MRMNRLNLTPNALRVLENRYLKKNEQGKVIETPYEMFRRVAHTIASAELLYDGENLERVEQEFFDMMVSLEFLPNSPTLMNAGTDIGQLSACFVLPVGDSMEEIFGAVKAMAIIHQSGGGTGFSFSNLRPQGDVVRSTGGVASGPVSFMRVFDTATEVIKQGGRRRGANMGVLRVDHPDILEFIQAKEKEGLLENFNLSVAVTDKFMDAVAKDSKYFLVNPRTHKRVNKLNANKVFDLIAKNAWKTGDPGVIFIDEINRHNPTPEVGKIESTNPCVTADTWIMTAEGPRQVRELIGKKFVAVINSEKYKSLEKGFFETGVKPVYKLKTVEGFELRLTKDHPVMKVKRMTRYRTETEWINAGKLKPGNKIIVNNHRNFANWEGKYTEGEGYLIGLLLGDGTIKKDKVYLKRLTQEFELKFRTKAITKEMERASADFCRGLLRGLFDANGSVQGNQSRGVSVRLAQSNGEILKVVQRMLLRFGIFSRIYLNRRANETAKLRNGKGGVREYPIRAQHELVISNENIAYFSEKIGFGDSDKMEKLVNTIKNYKREMNRERFVATIEVIVLDGIEKVYDVQIPGINVFDANGFIVHNCGEQPLLPYESCNLGSINLSRMITNKQIDWKKLRQIVRRAVHFLDNVIDVNKYPLPEIEKMTKSNRKIGLGVMGFAEMLIQLGIPYDSDEALVIGERLMNFITTEARKKSVELGSRRGSFPNFNKSVWKDKGYKSMRNATVTTVAPTGSIGIIADASSGIEPLFAVAFVRQIMGGLVEINKFFEDIAKRRKFYTKELMDEIVSKGTIRDIKYIPEDIRRLFVTALDISPKMHVRIQAAFQKYTDNAVSKTVNLPNSATPTDIKNVYLLAYKLKCKGITVYRYGSKKEQVLYTNVEVSSDYSRGCRICSV